MTSANNISKKICETVCSEKGWNKEIRRNVVEVENGELWSFSVSNHQHKVSCRQCYEDTKGIVSYCTKTKKIYKYKVHNFNDFTVSRISPDGTKAYNVTTYKVDCEIV